jgi:dTDP-4-amino-4,6-dideoxygalactose transaminase
MLIPFLDLARQHSEIEAELTAALTRALSGGVFILGPQVSAFEEEWASFCEAREAAAVGCGTDALALALVASGAVRKGRGDEVITSPLTAAYTALAIMNAGGVPVFADIDPRTYTLAPCAIERAITPRTRAIVPVHLYGQMADMAGVCDVAARHGLVVIEDAAQAHGACLAGQPVKDEVRASAFSFYPTKNLGACGDAGAVVSNDVDLIARVKSLRQGGHPIALRGETEGRNSRLDEMQAALLRVKLKHLDAWNCRRRTLAAAYGEALRHVSRLQLPSAREPESHVFHLYVVQHPERDRLRAHLAARGIETMIHYPFLLHQQRLFSNDAQRTLPVAERAARQIISLPLYPQFTEEELRVVADAVIEFEA